MQSLQHPEGCGCIDQPEEGTCVQAKLELGPDAATLYCLDRGGAWAKIQAADLLPLALSLTVEAWLVLPRQFVWSSWEEDICDIEMQVCRSLGH